MSEDVKGAAPVTPQADAQPKETLLTPAEPKAEAPVPAEPAADQKAPAEATADEPKKSTETTDPKEAQPAVPEKYELKLPEGSQLEAKHVQEVESFAKEHKLSNAAAQAILDREAMARADVVAQQAATHERAVTGWAEAVKTDKEIGGNAYAKSVELSRRLVDRFGTKEFKDALNVSGLGNHPELVRFAARIAGAMSEDQFVLGGKAAPTPKRAADILYPPKPKE